MDNSSTPAPEQVLSSNSEVLMVQGNSKKIDKKSSNLPEEHASSSSAGPALEKKKRKRNESPGVRVVGGRIYDSQNGKTCHQCRQKTMDIMASCKNQIKGKQCTIKYCHKCLLNRYGEKAEEVTVLEDWFCPKCKGICNCSFCRKKMGQPPTGILVHTAKSTGFSSVSEMLLVKGSDIQSVKKESSSTQVIPKNKGKAKEISDEPKAKKAKKGKKNNTDMVGIHDEDATKMLIVYEETEIALPQGTELRTVARIELQPDEVGHALQLLEFCSAFGEILELKKDASEYILRELIRGGDGCIGRSSPVAQFLVRLLSLMQTDSGKSSPAMTHRLNHKTSWLLALHKCIISGSPYLSGNLDKFDGGADSYNSLNSAERLTLVNFVCDEVLSTKKVRNWMDEQQLKYSERIKETKQKVTAANKKEKQLKQKMKDVVIKAINAKNGVPPLISNSEHTTIVSQIEMEVAQAHAEMLESKEMLCKLEKQDCISVRTKPILMDNGGRTFWRLNGCGDESRIFLQETSLPDESEFRETWFTYEEEEQVDKVKKYISFKEKK